MTDTTDNTNIGIQFGVPYTTSIRPQKVVKKEEKNDTISIENTVCHVCKGVINMALPSCFTTDNSVILASDRENNYTLFPMHNNCFSIKS